MKLAASLLLFLLVLGGFVLGSEPMPSVVDSPPPSTEGAIRQAELPWRDLRDLAVRVKGAPPEVATFAPSASAQDRQVGERDNFWVADQASNVYYTVSASLRVVTPHAYLYVADDARVDMARLQEAALFFEDTIYAEARRYFGPEPPMGIDGDSHVTILHASIPGLGGYFTSVDDYPRSVHPYSNERKILYVNVDAAPPGSSGYYGILAHEFEHMIQWNTSRAEQTWIKEGSAELATEAVLSSSSGAQRAFEARADTQLNAWADSKGDVAPHYGGAYMFLSYFLEQFGGYDVAADLLTGSTRGPETFDRFLSSRGYSRSFEDVFKDWIVANYLDEAGVGDPRYRYRKLRVRVPPTDRIAASTNWQNRTVHQFAADYMEVGGRWSTASIHFQGDPTTRVIPVEARSGRSYWWSNRADLVDTKLTRAFDLSELSAASLRFWAWYDLEDGYDYAYVMVSQDDGATWQTLAGTHTTVEDPNGNSLGDGFTGRSGGGETAEWVEESVDLTPYVGGTVLVRFEHVTDDAYNAPGFAVDDVSIPELGYQYDAEEDDGWSTNGFVRTDGVLAEPFSLQLIRFGDDITVEEVPVSASGDADVVVENPDGRLQKVVLVVAPLSRYTTERANYRYQVEMTP